MKAPKPTESDIRRLYLDLANLKFAVADKEQEIAEKELELSLQRTACGSTQARSQPDTNTARGPVANATPDRVTSTPTRVFQPPVPPRDFHPTLPAEVHETPRIYTGLKDANKTKLYEGDIVSLRTQSTGTLGQYFRIGQRVRVTGTTRDSLLFLDHLTIPGKFTRRHSSNVFKCIE